MWLASASQIDTFRLCPRKWAWRYIAGIRTAPAPSAALGTEVDDTQLQPYLRDGRPIDYTRESGYIAATALDFLPPPRAEGLAVQQYFDMPSPTSEDIGFQGYMDLWLPDGRIFPDVGEAGIPVVCDFKTTSNLRWAKTPEALAVDVQATTYAVAAMYFTGRRVVDLVWIYMQTRGAKRARRVHLRIGADLACEQFQKTDETARHMSVLRALRPDPNEVPHDPSGCDAYGGCPYRDRCNLSPADMLAPNIEIGEFMSNASSLLARLTARKAAASPVVAPPPASAPPAAAPSEPAPALAVVGKDASGLNVYAFEATAPASPIATVSPAAVNPPESALPPADPVNAAPAKRGPGRPKGAKNRADEAEQAYAAVTVTWGEETFCPVAYNPCRVGPFSVTGVVREGESIGEAQARLYAELEAFAAKAREAKLRSFAEALGTSGGK